MRLKGGLRAAIINASEGYLSEMNTFPENVQVDDRLEGQYDWVQIFVKDKTNMEKLAPQAICALKPEGLLWITFPKGTSGIQKDLTRDKGWEIVQQADLKWINLISVNAAWSAFSLRPFRSGEKRQSFR